MRFFNASDRPSARATTDFDAAIARHQARIRGIEHYEEGSDFRTHASLTVGTLGGMAGFGAIVAVGAGALSAAVLPIALPIAAIVGVAGLAGVVLNKITMAFAAREKTAEQTRIRGVEREKWWSHEPVAPLPNLAQMTARFEAIQQKMAQPENASHEIAGVTAKVGRRPSV